MLMRSASRWCGLSVCALGLAIAGTGCRSASIPEAPVALAETGGSALTAGPPPRTFPPTSDPRQALANMVAAYKSLQSAYIVFDSDIRLGGSRSLPAHQTSIIEYTHKPDRMAVRLQDPKAGTFDMIADGTSLVVYTGLQNQYLRKDLHRDLAGIGKAIADERRPILSPVVFLASSRLPPGIASVRMRGTQDVGGRPAYVIAGEFTPAYVQWLGQGMGFSDGVRALRSQFTVWLDRSTYLLQKSTLSLALRGPVRTPGATRVLEATVDATTTTARFIPNPRIPESDLRFTPPKNAKQLYAGESEL